MKPLILLVEDDEALLEHTRIILENNEKVKEILEKAFIIHSVKENKIVFSKTKNFIYSKIFRLEDKKQIKNGSNSISRFPA